MNHIKKLIIFTMLTFIVLSMSGCWIYGKGETTGYIYAVDDGIVWSKIWYKSSLDSSESDCYLTKSESLKEALRALEPETLVRLKYNRHFVTIADCEDSEVEPNDEVVSFEIIQGD